MEKSNPPAPDVELRERGQLTLPKSVRDELHLEAGDKLRTVRIGNAVVLIPRRMDLDAIRSEVRKLMKRSGITADEILRDL
jgi:AbrB family looped-hinge helix DNA binding protein